MSFYRKKPVVIEARQFDGTVEDAIDLCKWIGVVDSGYEQDRYGRVWLNIHTLEGPTRRGFLMRGPALFFPAAP